MAQEQRRLAAILFVDAVRSSWLMGQDESGTVARLLDHLNQRLAPAVARRGGRVIRLKGDGGLIEFASAVDALAAAIDFQQAMIDANRDEAEDKIIAFRVGLHLGDVIVKDDDIYGDDVNVAARLEAQAPPAGIVVSRAVRDAVQTRLKVTLHPLGDLTLKNIVRPVRAFRVEWSAQDWPATDVLAGTTSGMPAAATMDAPRTSPEKASIAVLPFKNMTDDPEQDYFVDGLVEDITRALSRNSWLFVVACGSSFAYKGHALDARKIGRELNVRYVLVGSIRKAGNRLRIGGEVVDVVTGGSIWTDRYEGALEDVFDFQDSITSSVIAVIGPKVLHLEIARAQVKPTISLTAYDLCLRAFALIFKQTPDACLQALTLLNKAVEFDPNFSSAYGLIASCYVDRAVLLGLVEEDRAAALEAARRAIETGRDNPDALARAGLCIAFLGERPQEGLQHLERALNLNPNSLAILRFAGFVYNQLGDHAKALAVYDRSIRLGSMDADAWGSYLGIAFVHFFARRFGESLRWIDKAFAERPDHPVVAFVKFAAMAASDQPPDELQVFIRKWLGNRPPLPISAIRQRMSAFRQVDVELLVDALRKAGLPERPSR